MAAIRWLRSFTFLALACLPWTADGALTPRIVQVVVTIEAQSFREGLGDARRQLFESTIATEVAASLGQQYPLIDWSATADAELPAGRLVAAVTERQPPILPNGVQELNPEVNLEWRAEIGGQALAMPSVFPQLLYSSTRVDRPIHDERGEFLALLREKIVGWARSDTNHLKLEFLRYVPLATEVVVQSDKQVVLIPVPWQQSRIGEKSIFRLSYRRGSDAPEQTRIMLSGLAQRLTDPLLGDTQSHVSECTRDGASIAAAQLWQSCVEPLSTNPPSLRINVNDYIYDANPGVSDGTVLDDH